MTTSEMSCWLVRPQAVVRSPQGLLSQPGISLQTAGSVSLHMQLVIIPPCSQGRAHKHAHHETALYALSGTTRIRYGVRLERELEVPEGSFLYIPADLPHLPYNPGNQAATVVVARTDACDPESVVMLPELDVNVLSESGAHDAASHLSGKCDPDVAFFAGENI